MSIFWTESSKLKMPILFLRVPGIVLLKGEFGPKQPRELERRWTGTGRKLFISLSHSFFLPQANSFLALLLLIFHKSRVWGLDSDDNWMKGEGKGK
jgi:hypothetical protein